MILSLTIIFSNLVDYRLIVFSIFDQKSRLDSIFLTRLNHKLVVLSLVLHNFMKSNDQFSRLYIFSSTIQNILVTTYNDNHSNFARYHKKITFIYYIRNLTRYFRDYLKHCSICQIYQTR